MAFTLCRFGGCAARLGGGRVGGRVELWNGNRERWRNFFALDKEESVIVWAWQTHASNRARYEAAMADPLNAHLRFIRLRSAESVRRFLRSVAGAVPVPGGSPGGSGGSGGSGASSGSGSSSGSGGD